MKRRARVSVVRGMTSTAAVSLGAFIIHRVFFSAFFIQH